MTPLNVKYFSSNAINHDSRLLVKDNQLYVETHTPNIFTRFWRYIHHRYNRDRIIKQTISLGNSLLKDNSTVTPQSVKNFQVIRKSTPLMQENLREEFNAIEVALLLHSPAGTDWKNAIIDNELLEEMWNECLYEVSQDFSFPEALLSTSTLIPFISSDYNAKCEAADLKEILSICGILTPKDCIRQGISPNRESFEEYFKTNKQTLITALLAKGFIVSQ